MNAVVPVTPYTADERTEKNQSQEKVTTANCSAADVIEPSEEQGTTIL